MFRRVNHRLAACLLLGLASSSAAEPARIVGGARRTAQRFNEAGELERNQRWAEAVEVYLRLLDDAGDDLVADDADILHHLPARALIHWRIAGRPDLLGPFRARADARARKLLDQGIADRDPRPLERLVETLFCARPAEAALHQLGDLACEAGDFDKAARYWRLLEPATAGRLAYPDPQGDPALPRAKQILTRLLADDVATARPALAAFRKAFPSAVGHLAGVDGNYGETLQKLLESADTTRVPGRVCLAATPTTFAGDGSRNGVLTGTLPPFAPEPRYPPITLPDAPLRPDDGRVVQRPLVRPAALAYHPLIAWGQILVADARRVTAFDLATGRQSSQFDLANADVRVPAGLETRAANLESRHTLTVSGDRVYARLGQPKMRGERGDADSYIVCLKWTAGQLQPRWTLPALKPDGPMAMFEGTPVVRDGRMFVATTRLDGNRAITAVACYDPGDPNPVLLWAQDGFEAGAESAERSRQLLLTLAGPMVVCGPHAGAVVALDAATGRRMWARQYAPRDGFTASGEPSPRDLCPCVHAAGRVYAAPADHGRVLCLDAADGGLIWESDALEVAHLLGVVGGRLYAIKGGFVGGLCCLDGVGKQVADWGYGVHGGDAMAPFGRGLIAEDRIYWPTRGDGVREVRLDGTSEYAPTAFRGLPGGNLAYGDGCLVVATDERLHVLVAPKSDDAKPIDAAAKGDAIDARGRLWQSPRSPRLVGTRTRPPTPAPELDGDLVVAWRMSLEPRRERALSIDSADLQLVGGPKSLSARRVPDGRELWRRELPFAPSWADRDGDDLVVGGADGLARLASRDGAPAWAFAVPEVDPTYDALVGWQERRPARIRRPTLTDHQFVAERVVCRLGESSIVAFDATTGTLLWQHFAARHRADESGCVAQSADGRVRVLELATGKTRWSHPHATDPWVEPPLFFDDKLVVCAEEQYVIAHDIATGHAAWTYLLPRWPSLTGEPPRVRLDGGTLLVGIARNDGFEVERLDAATGERLGEATVAGRDPVSLAAVIALKDSMLVANGAELRSIRLDRVVARRDLEPAAGWRLDRIGPEWLACYPSEPQAPSREGRLWLVPTNGGAAPSPMSIGPRARVRVRAGELVVATDREVFGLRPRKRETK